MFGDLCTFLNRWILSKAKKDNVDEAVSKYDGEYLMRKPGLLVIPLLFYLVITVSRYFEVLIYNEVFVVGE